MKNNDLHKANETFLAEWLAGDITDETLKTLVSKEDFKSFLKIRKGIHTLDGLKAPIDDSLDKINTRIGQKQSVVRPLYPKRLIAGIAASILILFGLFTFLDDDLIGYDTNYGEQRTIALLDGSEVILNSKSTLQYNEDEWSSKRFIELDGEAFFKVSKGSAFTVKTQNGSVTVLGTQFDVNAFDDYFEVTCYEGKVSVETQSEMIILLPGQTVRRINGDAMEKWQSNSDIPSWLSGESTFKSVPIKYVISTLESQYDISINADTIDDSIKYTGSFTHGDLDIALQTVFKSLDLKYIEKEKGNIYLSAQ